MKSKINSLIEVSQQLESLIDDFYTNDHQSEKQIVKLYKFHGFILNELSGLGVKTQVNKSCLLEYIASDDLNIKELPCFNTVKIVTPIKIKETKKEIGFVVTDNENTQHFFLMDVQKQKYESLKDGEISLVYDGVSYDLQNQK